MGSRDNRRIAGPEKTTPIHVLQPPVCRQFLGNDNLRNDKRSPLEIRKIYMGLSNLSQAKGSSYIEMGNTKVVCAVDGPREMPPSNTFKLTGNVGCEVRFCPFSSRCRRSPLPSSHVRELSTQLKQALEAAVVLEQYPKAQIDVNITVIEDNGGLLAACVVAASLALCDASIQLYDVVVAASLVWYKNDIYLDPSLEEEDDIGSAAERLAEPSAHLSNKQSQLNRVPASSIETSSAEPATIPNGATIPNDATPDSNGCLTVGVMPLYGNGQVALMVQSGSVTGEKLEEGLDLALDSCRKVYAIVKQVLLEKSSKCMEGSRKQESSE